MIVKFIVFFIFLNQLIKGFNLSCQSKKKWRTGKSFEKYKKNGPDTLLRPHRPLYGENLTFEAAHIGTRQKSSSLLALERSSIEVLGFGAFWGLKKCTLGHQNKSPLLRVVELLYLFLHSNSIFRVLLFNFIKKTTSGTMLLPGLTKYKTPIRIKSAARGSYFDLSLLYTTEKAQNKGLWNKGLSPLFDPKFKNDK